MSATAMTPVVPVAPAAAEPPLPVNVSLLGGPLHDLGKRLGLVRGDSNTILFGIAIGWSLWGLLMLFALARGATAGIFKLTLIATHVRLLVVIPLLFFCESTFDPMVRLFVRSLFQSNIVAGAEREGLLKDIERMNRRIDSWVPDVLSLLFAMFFWSTGLRLPHYDAGRGWDPAANLFADTVLVNVYFTAGMTLFRFLVFRWVWRLLTWFRFLWRLSRLKLRLIAAHSDRAGGLGGLEIVHLHLLPLIAAVSVLTSAMLAQELARGLPFSSIYPGVVFGVAACVVFVYGPMFVFTTALTVCRENAFFAYTALVSRYVSSFERKWLVAGAPDSELLGSADLQSLADLTNSVDVVREMRVIPSGMRLLWAVVAASLVPYLPLWLFQYSLTDLLQKFVGRILGG